MPGLETQAQQTSHSILPLSKQQTHRRAHLYLVFDPFWWQWLRYFQGNCKSQGPSGRLEPYSDSIYMSGHADVDREELSDTDIFELHSGVDASRSVPGSPEVGNLRDEEPNEGLRSFGCTTGRSPAWSSSPSGPQREGSPSGDNVSDAPGREESVKKRSYETLLSGNENVRPGLWGSLPSPAILIQRPKVSKTEPSPEEEASPASKFIPPHVLVESNSVPAGAANEGFFVGTRYVKPGSVVEGAGRTLRGRDATKFRTAVMRSTGFLDG